MLHDMFAPAAMAAAFTVQVRGVPTAAVHVVVHVRFGLAHVDPSEQYLTTNVVPTPTTLGTR